MDTMTPAYGSGTLLLIAAIAVAVLLVLIIALRMHAFVALVLVSLGTAVAAGVPLAEVPTISIAAFGSTLGSVALLVGLGVMIGRLLEVTGGAQVLADTLISRFGEKRAPMALGVAALLFGLPIFFDAGLVVFLGQTPVALLIALLVATYTLAVRRYSRGEVETLLNDALGPICAIILITGAGGMFGGVLRYSGIGAALSDSLADLGLPLIVSAFVIATILRVAQGSATVALTTTAGLISAGVADADPSSLQLVALVLAIAAGATVLSHVNDSGFWLVGRFFGMDVKTTLRTWTVLETTLGVSIFVLALGVWAIG